MMITLIHPLYDFTITQSFGANPAQYGSRGHQGIDFRARYVDGYPVARGQVLYALHGDTGYGNHLIIEHDFGRTLYAHLEKMYVEVGQTVEEDQIIYQTGNSGRSTAPHLHFELQINGKAVDPMPYFTISRKDYMTKLEQLEKTVADIQKNFEHSDIVQTTGGEMLIGPKFGGSPSGGSVALSMIYRYMNKPQISKEMGNSLKTKGWRSI